MPKMGQPYWREIGRNVSYLGVELSRDGRHFIHFEKLACGSPVSNDRRLHYWRETSQELDGKVGSTFPFRSKCGIFIHWAPPIASRRNARRCEVCEGTALRLAWEDES